MKKFLYIIAWLMLFGSVLLVDGCRKDEDSVVKSESSFAFIKGVNRQRLTEFDPELLNRIKKDLLDKKNTALANRLSNTYDFKTGKLFPEALEYAKPYNRARVSSLTWHNDWCAYDGSGNPPACGINNYPNSNNTISFGAVGYWITSFQFDTYPTYYPSNWGGSNSFCYNGCIQGENNCVGPTGVNNYVTTGNKNKRFDSYWIYVGPELACYVFYRSLLSDYSMTSWTSNGNFCGTIGSGKSIITMEVQIVDIDDCD